MRHSNSLGTHRQWLQHMAWCPAVGLGSCMLHGMCTLSAHVCSHAWSYVVCWVCAVLCVDAAGVFVSSSRHQLLRRRTMVLLCGKRWRCCCVGSKEQSSCALARAFFLAQGLFVWDARAPTQHTGAPINCP